MTDDIDKPRLSAKNLEEVPTFELMDEMANRRMTLANDPNDVCGYWFISTGTNEQMLDSCVWHDKAYTEGSWAQANLSRKEVDQWFYQQMLLIAGDNTLRRLKAKAFYVVARGLGWLLWEGKR